MTADEERERGREREGGREVGVKVEEGKEGRERVYNYW